MKKINLNVKENMELVEYLTKYSDYSKSKIKSLIKYKKVYVNRKNNFKLPIVVKINDVIEIDLEVKEELPFDIVYEDNEIIVVNKVPGLLTIANYNEKELTLYHQVREYANKNNFKLFIVHRLDRETSGLVMFAKSERMKMLFQDNWNELVKTRGYFALIEGKLAKKGRIDNLLYEEKNTFVHSSKLGKRAITNYEPIKYNEEYSLLDVNIETGRKNQIRVHLSELGYPIVGDKKYGSKKNPIKRLGLHAYKLEIMHPITRNYFNFELDMPKEFKRMF
jgi:23S rRNA pseudouridine1911/1915/1917 synthase